MIRSQREATKLSLPSIMIFLLKLNWELAAFLGNSTLPEASTGINAVDFSDYPSTNNTLT